MIAACRIPTFAALADKPRLAVPPRFHPPPVLGNWEYFLAPEPQGDKPWCVAFSMCAILQAAFWRQFGFPVQFAEGPLYAACKKRDGDTNDGTWLESAIATAKLYNYGGIQLPPPVIAERMTSHAGDLPWLIHRYGAAMVALMIDQGWDSPRQPDALIEPRGDILGGHAVVATWYDLNAGRVGGYNWWGPGRERWSMTLAGFKSQFVYGYGMTIAWEGVTL